MERKKQLKTIEWFFAGVLSADEFVADKTTANNLREYFKETEPQEFFEGLYNEALSLTVNEDEMTDEEVNEEVVKLGVYFAEYFKFKTGTDVQAKSD